MESDQQLSCQPFLEDAPQALFLWMKGLNRRLALAGAPIFGKWKPTKTWTLEHIQRQEQSQGVYIYISVAQVAWKPSDICLAVLLQWTSSQLGWPSMAIKSHHKQQNNTTYRNGFAFQNPRVYHHSAYQHLSTSSPNAWVKVTFLSKPKSNLLTRAVSIISGARSTPNL